MKFLMNRQLSSLCMMVLLSYPLTLHSQTVWAWKDIFIASSTLFTGITSWYTYNYCRTAHELREAKQELVKVTARRDQIVQELTQLKGNKSRKAFLRKLMSNESAFSGTFNDELKILETRILEREKALKIIVAFENKPDSLFASEHTSKNRYIENLTYIGQKKLKEDIKMQKKDWIEWCKEHLQNNKKRDEEIRTELILAKTTSFLPSEKQLRKEKQLFHTPEEQYNYLQLLKKQMDYFRNAYKASDKLLSECSTELSNEPLTSETLQSYKNDLLLQHNLGYDGLNTIAQKKRINRKKYDELGTFKKPIQHLDELFSAIEKD
jgi:hypothetical protein